jgi:hypothetical protein
LREIGTNLWSGLLSGEIRSAVADARQDKSSFFQLRLRLPPEFEKLPWEALHDQSSKTFLAEHSRMCIIRDAECDSPDV